MIMRKQDGESAEHITSQADSKLLLTIPEVAFRLGLGRSFVYQLVMSGKIPSIKLGRARRVPASALEDFVAGRLKDAYVDDI